MAIVVGSVLLVLLLLVGIGGFAYTVMRDDTGSLAQDADEPADRGGPEDVIHYDSPTNTHVTVGERVTYEMHPPAGGDHYAAWQNCGVYDEPVFAELAVHSQEHGAVWITHAPDLDGGQLETLHDLYSPGDYLVISPMADLPAPVVASAWGTQIHLEDAEDPRLVEYLIEYERSENVPEPGAPCSGSVGDTEAEVEAEIEDGPGGEDEPQELTEEEIEELFDQLPEEET